jgi:hypothetical protein
MNRPPPDRPLAAVPTDEHRLELLVDALAFAFVTTCVQQMRARPSLNALHHYRDRVKAVLRRASEDVGNDEPTEPREPRTGPHRR